jgi:hypothetical protein
MDQDEQNNSSVVIQRKGPLNILSSVKIYMNNEFVGQVGPGRYLKMAVPAGNYIIKAKGLSNVSFYNLTAKEKTTYLISLKHKMKLTNQVDIKAEVSTNRDISKIKKPEIKVIE